VSGARGGNQERRLRLARESYLEVLDATKHQDDKIGRFLTAIAFLFTGAIAFGTRTDLLAVRYEVDGHVLPLPAILLGLFLVLSVISVLLLVIGLGPNLKLPRPERERGAAVLGRKKSRLFFFSISDMTLDQWRALWRDPHPSLGDMITTYVDETYNLATKTDFKYSRTNEARAVFTVGLMFLALSVTLGFDALSDHPASPSNILTWSQASRTYVALITGVFAFALVYDYMRLEQELDSVLNTRERWFRLDPLYLLVFAIPTFVVSLVTPGASPNALFRVIATGAVVLAGLALFVLGGPRWRRGWFWRLGGTAVAAAGATLALWTLRLNHYVPRLALALSAIVAAELPRLLRASELWRRRRRSALG